MGANSDQYRSRAEYQPRERNDLATHLSCHPITIAAAQYLFTSRGGLWRNPTHWNTWEVVPQSSSLTGPFKATRVM